MIFHKSTEITMVEIKTAKIAITPAYTRFQQLNHSTAIKPNIHIGTPHMDSSPSRPTHIGRPPCSLFVDCDFDSTELLKQACREFAVQGSFEFITKKLSKSIYTIVCKDKGCPWRLYASSIEGTHAFCIKTFQSEHACFGINHPGNQQATAAMIASKIAEKIKDQPNYRPVDIVLDIKHELGVDVTYSKALRTREVALELNNGIHEDAYKNLPQYCQDLEAADPKTKAFVERNVDNKFHRMFLCHSACAVGFIYCRPLLGLNGTHLKSKYKGIQ